MASHFKWYPSSEDTIVPWNARYVFPSQSNKAEKITPRIPPKNGSVFAPGQVIRVEFPAQGYVNPTNTTLEFDVTLFPYETTPGIVRFQNNIQSIFRQVRLMYGSTPLETIMNYNQIVRSLTEWTSTNQGVMDQTGIAEGIGGAQLGITAGNIWGLFNTRQKYIQGLASADFAATGVNFRNTAMPPQTVGIGGAPVGPGNAAALTATRRYQVNLALGLFTQEKLIPVKFMASQLAIELTLEQPEACIYAASRQGSSSGKPTYAVGHVNLIPEILTFDASYGRRDF